MLSDITIGQYIPTGSVLHRMDARVKILLLCVYLVLLFMVNAPSAYLLIGAATVGLVALSRVSVKFVLRGLKPMFLILVLTMIFNLFLTPGETLVSFPVFRWHFTITHEGLKTAILMFLRLLFLVITSSLLTLTTAPLMLTDGIERLLRPFDRFHVPSHEIAMMMSIALRFIPTFAEEAEKIKMAQTARGADFTSGNLITRAKAMIPVLIPLFVGAFRRADDLATAMEARCYRGGKGRTRLKKLMFGKGDALSLVIFVLFAAAMILPEFLM